jgi:hypothetical protein
MTDGIKLKNCPFCGGEANLLICGDRVKVACAVCFAQIGERWGYGAKERSIEAWNTRTEEGMIEQEKAMAAAFGIVAGVLESKDFQNIALEALRQGLGIVSNIKLEETKNEAD